MSETGSTIVKLLSTLTSPKACVKYIAVAVFTILSWKYFNNLLLNAGVPEDHINIVILLLGVGIGALIGQGLSYMGTLLWNSIQNKRKYKKAKKAKALAIAEKKAKDEVDNKKLVEIYKKSFSHFSWKQKEILRSLTKEEKTLDLREQPFKALYDNKYILPISHISGNE